jgi:hypothetical protein
MNKVDMLKKYKSKYFIETGSYNGEGIQAAIDAGFENIISIELTPDYFNICASKFQNNQNVKIINGNSVDVLNDVLKNINESCTFFLDAHYMDETTMVVDKWCPLMDELEVIKKHIIGQNIIMVNDMRCWQESNGFYQNYNFNNDDIKNKIKEISPDVEFSYEDGYIADDILVAKFTVKAVEETSKVKAPIAAPKTIKKTSKTKKR